ncbi:MAG: TetR family transcriptional regulator [Holophagaceae bacterium]|nr:TetR family transcriptional regulator [Holophagaceae bacterium]
MPAKPLPQPRKAPRQKRSLETVDAILAATAHILSKEGLEKATTNHIAARAGVSIGSLYQYFPNKESLVRALNDRHTQEILALLSRRFEEVREAPIPDAVRAIVRAMVDVHRHDPDLHRVLVQATPAVGAKVETRRLEAAAGRLLVGFFQARAAELRIQDFELSAFLLVQSVEALTHAAVLEHPGLLEDERFVEETTRMIVGYLTDGVEPAGKARRSRRKS